MSNTKMSLRIVEENVDPSSKRGIHAVLSDGFEEKQKLIYPLESGENEAFFEDLKKLRHEFLPRIEGYVDQGGRKLALTAPAEGQLLTEARETISDKNAVEIAKDLADTMDAIHEEGFAFRNLAAKDILINENGLVLPPPAWPATEENVLLDFGSVGGICYELLTGLDYKPGTVITEDTIPAQVPYGARLVIVNATSRDSSLNYDNARDMIRAFDSKKRRGAPSAPVRRPQPSERRTEASSSGLAFEERRKEPTRFGGFDEEPARAPRREAASRFADREEEPARVPKREAAPRFEEPEEEPVRRRSPGREEEKSGGGFGKTAIILLLGLIVIVGVVLAAVLIHGAGKNGKADAGYDSLVAGAYRDIADEKYEDARASAKEAREEDADRLTSYYVEALSYYKEGDYEKTVSFIESEIMKKKFDLVDGEDELPQNIYYILGCSYYGTGDYENAYKKLANAEEHGYDKEKTANLMLLAAIGLENGNAVAEVMEKEAMGDAGKAYTEAVKEETDGNYNAAALKYYEAAGLLEGEAADYCVLKTVDAYVKAADYDAAINASDNSLKAGISKELAAKLWEKKAVAEKDKAKSVGSDPALFETAIKSFETVIELGGNEASANYFMGECYLYLRNEEAGKAALTKAYESDDEAFSARAKALMEANGLLEPTGTDA